MRQELTEMEFLMKLFSKEKRSFAEGNDKGDSSILSAIVLNSPQMSCLGSFSLSTPTSVYIEMSYLGSFSLSTLSPDFIDDNLPDMDSKSEILSEERLRAVSIPSYWYVYVNPDYLTAS